MKTKNTIMIILLVMLGIVTALAITSTLAKAYVKAENNSEMMVVVYSDYDNNIDLVADKVTNIVYFSKNGSLTPYYEPEGYSCRYTQYGSIIENHTGEIVINAEQIKEGK